MGHPPGADDHFSITLSLSDIEHIKQFAFYEWEKLTPKNLSRERHLQVYLIVKSFSDFLASKNIPITVTFKLD